MNLNMEEIKAAPQLVAAKINLDQRLVNIIGRIPACIIIGGITGAIAEIIIRVFRYASEITDVYDQLDSIVRFLSPSFGYIGYYGALGGLSVGLFVGVLTNKIDSWLKRAASGIIAGLMVRILTELVIRLIKDGNLGFAINFVIICRNQIIIAGIIVGLFVALIPLRK